MNYFNIPKLHYLCIILVFFIFQTMEVDHFIQQLRGRELSELEIPHTHLVTPDRPDEFYGKVSTIAVAVLYLGLCVSYKHKFCILCVEDKSIEIFNYQG